MGRGGEQRESRDPSALRQQLRGLTRKIDRIGLVSDMDERPMFANAAVLGNLKRIASESQDPNELQRAIETAHEALHEIGADSSEELSIHPPAKQSTDEAPQEALRLINKAALEQEEIVTEIERMIPRITARHARLVELEAMPARMQEQIARMFVQVNELQKTTPADARVMLRVIDGQLTRLLQHVEGYNLRAQEIEDRLRGYNTVDDFTTNRIARMRRLAESKEFQQAHDIAVDILHTLQEADPGDLDWNEAFANLETDDGLTADEVLGRAQNTQTAEADGTDDPFAGTILDDAPKADTQHGPPDTSLPDISIDIPEPEPLTAEREYIDLLFEVSTLWEVLPKPRPAVIEALRADMQQSADAGEYDTALTLAHILINVMKGHITPDEATTQLADHGLLSPPPKKQPKVVRRIRKKRPKQVERRYKPLTPQRTQKEVTTEPDSPEEIARKEALVGRDVRSVEVDLEQIAGRPGLSAAWDNDPVVRAQRRAQEAAEAREAAYQAEKVAEQEAEDQAWRAELLRGYAQALSELLDEEQSDIHPDVQRPFRNEWEARIAQYSATDFVGADTTEADVDAIVAAIADIQKENKRIAPDLRDMDATAFTAETQRAAARIQELIADSDVGEEKRTILQSRWGELLRNPGLLSPEQLTELRIEAEIAAAARAAERERKNPAIHMARQGLRDNRGVLSRPEQRLIRSIIRELRGTTGEIDFWAQQYPRLESLSPACADLLERISLATTQALVLPDRVIRILHPDQVTDSSLAPAQESELEPAAERPQQHTDPYPPLASESEESPIPVEKIAAKIKQLPPHGQWWFANNEALLRSGDVDGINASINEFFAPGGLLDHAQQAHARRSLIESGTFLDVVRFFDQFPGIVWPDDIRAAADGIVSAEVVARQKPHPPLPAPERRRSRFAESKLGRWLQKILLVPTVASAMRSDSSPPVKSTEEDFAHGARIETAKVVHDAQTQDGGLADAGMHVDAQGRVTVDAAVAPPEATKETPPPVDTPATPETTPKPPLSEAISTPSAEPVVPPSAPKAEASAPTVDVTVTSHGIIRTVKNELHKRHYKPDVINAMVGKLYRESKRNAKTNWDNITVHPDDTIRLTFDTNADGLKVLSAVDIPKVTGTQRLQARLERRANEQAEGKEEAETTRIPTHTDSTHTVEFTGEDGLAKQATFAVGQFVTYKGKKYIVLGPSKDAKKSGFILRHADSKRQFYTGQVAEIQADTAHRGERDLGSGTVRRMPGTSDEYRFRFTGGSGIQEALLTTLTKYFGIDRPTALLTMRIAAAKAYNTPIPGKGDTVYRGLPDFVEGGKASSDHGDTFDFQMTGTEANPRIEIIRIDKQDPNRTELE